MMAQLYPKLYKYATRDSYNGCRIDFTFVLYTRISLYFIWMWKEREKIEKEPANAEHHIYHLRAHTIIIKWKMSEAYESGAITNTRVISHSDVQLSNSDWECRCTHNCQIYRVFQHFVAAHHISIDRKAEM